MSLFVSYALLMGLKKTVWLIKILVTNAALVSMLGFGTQVLSVFEKSLEDLETIQKLLF